MLSIAPDHSTDHRCPACNVSLTTNGWYVPGMRSLVSLSCPRCDADFYGDLRIGQAGMTPQLLSTATGVVHDQHDVGWFAEWLRAGYANRVDRAPAMQVLRHRQVSRPVVFLNCLDAVYGHVLLKLLSAQALLDRDPPVDLIVMIPASFQWLVPDGVAEVWLIDWPLAQGSSWNDGLAREVARRLSPFAGLQFAGATSHPSPASYDIERFTRVAPFVLGPWRRELDRPTVTFIWRERREWIVPAPWTMLAPERLKPIRRMAHEAVKRLERRVRRLLPSVDFAVAGVGTPGGLPSSIRDLRTPRPDAQQELLWCRRYAVSHLVVGAHGSNMLLPSAHAGGVVELLPGSRWGNFLQDLLFRPADARELFFRYRFLPDTATPEDVGTLAAQILTGFPRWFELMGERPCAESPAP